MQTKRYIAGATAGLAAVMLMAGATSAPAKDTQAAWQGYISVIGRTTRCGTIGGTAVGGTHVSIFRPHIRATDSHTFLSVMQTRASFTLDNKSEATVHQMHGVGNYTASVTNSRARAFTYNGTYALTVSPATITAATQVVQITGTIKNVFNARGCNVKYKGIYVKRID